MEEIKKRIKEYRMISDSSLRIYSQNVSKLATGITGEPYENADFLLDINKVLDQIKDKSLSTKKNYLASVLVFLNPEGYNTFSEELEPVIKEYNKLLKDYHVAYMAKIEEQHKNAKESENWVTMASLLKINKKHKNDVRRMGITLNCLQISDKYKLDALQKYLVSSLYLYHPPRRCEYGDMEIISKAKYAALPETVRDNNNFLVVAGRTATKKFFSFGNFKNRNSIGMQKISIKKNLNTVLNLWLKHNPTKHFLLDSRGKKMSRNSLSKYLCKVFENTGVKISANMLRHIYLTEKYGNESTYKEKQEDAAAMAHSVQVQQQHYVKVD
jgi:hypothetical protein